MKQSRVEFDVIANEYDAGFSYTALGRLLRERVWNHTDSISARSPTDKSTGRVLELNCGTGEDAIWLAKQGFHVLATDSSPEMVALTKAKIEQAGLNEKVRVQVCAFTEIGQLSENNFDLIFSNFGGLNCISPEELENLGVVIAQKLKPGGKFIAVVMSRFCWWESLYFLLKGKHRDAFRRFGKGPVDARLGTHTTIPTWYYSPSSFQKYLQLTSQKSKVKSQKSSIKPIGLWLPPSYLNLFFEKRPRLLGFLNFLEMKFAPSWLAFAADHFWICIDSHQS